MLVGEQSYILKKKIDGFPCHSVTISFDIFFLPVVFVKGAIIDILNVGFGSWCPLAA